MTNKKIVITLIVILLGTALWIAPWVFQKDLAAENIKNMKSTL